MITTLEAPSSSMMTAEAFLALPEDGMARWLIRGQLREKEDPEMTMRNKHHSVAEGQTTYFLTHWLRSQPEPRGRVVCGEAGFHLRQVPATFSAGTDVALITPEQAQLSASKNVYFEGPPLLIAEILSPSDTIEGFTERVSEYLDCGVPVVWIMNPYQKYITIHRKSQPTIALGENDILDGTPELPGFRVPVADFFG